MAGFIEEHTQVFGRISVAGQLQGREAFGDIQGIEEPEPRLWCELSDSRGLFHPNASRLMDLSYREVSAVLKVDENDSTVECRLLTVL